ncbi:DotD/TraH family lipoprotein [Klebsiella pneumoniae]|nr:DotD/TraH family lipoprotein [Klebsiella pneumoniae]
MCLSAKRKTNLCTAAGRSGIAEQAIKIKLAQDELYRAGAINRTRYKFPTIINANSQYVRVSWQGDAYELLEQFAKQRGLTLTSQGIKLPLPLNIDVGGSKVTFEQLLTLIRQQTQYRATINQKNLGELQSCFTSHHRRKVHSSEGPAHET